ncbi:MAG: sulfite exporter TauE/SafE family protein [Flavobacteriaceae bacterium]|nr:sulfite exporter TauE/SafE family protein [Flavobacteriaceae bacterium]
MYLTAFLLGLLGSFHCLGMCGPIAFVLPLNRKNKVMSIAQALLYHLGRLLSYTSIGLLFGLLGKGLYIAGLQQNLSVIIGILMILIVIIPSSIFSKFKIVKPIYSIISKVKMGLGLYLKKSSLKAFFNIGILNGLLPCGLVYMALFGAVSTGSSYDGALYMMLFGLGTIPMMTAALIFGNFLKTSLRNKIQKAIPIFVILIGVLFILRGLGLGIPYVSPPQQKLKIRKKPMMQHGAYIIDLKKEINEFSKT